MMGEESLSERLRRLFAFLFGARVLARAPTCSRGPRPRRGIRSFTINNIQRGHSFVPLCQFAFPFLPSSRSYVYLTSPSRLYCYIGFQPCQTYAPRLLRP